MSKDNSKETKEKDLKIKLDKEGGIYIFPTNQRDTRIGIDILK